MRSQQISLLPKPLSRPTVGTGGMDKSGFPQSAQTGNGASTARPGCLCADISHCQPRLVCFGAVWLVALVGWLVAGIGFLVAEAPNHSTGNELPVIGSLAGVAVLATIAWGFLLGRGRRSVWVSPSAVAGAAVEMFLYVAAMIAVPSPSGDDQDTAAGAGIVILGIPTALAILALLWLGAGIGIASRSHLGGQRAPFVKQSA